MSAGKDGVTGFKNAQDAVNMMEELLQQVTRARDEKIPLQEAMEISQEEMEAMYAMAFVAYSGKKYIEAQYLFSNLLMLNPRDERYSFGMASCLKVGGEFDQALLMYALSMAMDQQSAKAPFHAAECAWMSGNKENAVMLLQETIRRVNEGDAEHELYAKRAQIMLDNINAGAVPPKPPAKAEEDAGAAKEPAAKPVASPDLTMPPGKGGRRRFKV